MHLNELEPDKRFGKHKLAESYLDYAKSDYPSVGGKKGTSALEGWKEADKTTLKATLIMLGERRH